jgi:hypothetical protein
MSNYLSQMKSLGIEAKANEQAKPLEHIEQQLLNNYAKTFELLDAIHRGTTVGFFAKTVSEEAALCKDELNNAQRRHDTATTASTKSTSTQSHISAHVTPN